MSTTRLNELKILDQHLRDEIMAVKNCEQLNDLVDQYVTNNPFVEPNGKASKDEFKKYISAHLKQKNDVARVKIPGLFDKRHEIEKEMTKLNVETSIEELEKYLRNRNTAYQASDSLKRAGSNMLKVFGKKVNPDYRLRREYIEELIAKLNQVEKAPTKFGVKLAIEEKVKEGEKFKSTNNEESLEAVLEKIATRFDIAFKQNKKTI